jgi:hypothetical protein
MRPPRVPVWCAFALALTGTAVQAADSIRVIPLVRDDQVLVSFELVDGFTDEVRAAIASGLRTTFTYTVELRMEVPVWIDRTIDSVVISNSAEYDNLTRRHSLVRTLDGRVEEAQVTDDDALVRKWMTSLERLPLFRTSKLEANREYYLQVSVRARPHNGPFLSLTSPSGQAKFTFLR